MCFVSVHEWNNPIAAGYSVLNEIHNLPIEEKVRLVEELWDDIYNSSEPFPLQSWHRMKATERDAELDANPSIAISRKELWQRVKENERP